jgi:hypothetical protein
MAIFTSSFRRKPESRNLMTAAFWRRCNSCISMRSSRADAVHRTFMCVPAAKARRERPKIQPRFPHLKTTTCGFVGSRNFDIAMQVLIMLGLGAMERLRTDCHCARLRRCRIFFIFASLIFLPPVFDHGALLCRNVAG